MTSIAIPNSVTTIGNYAFNGCSGLTSITIPNSVKEIGGRAFEGCSSLTSIAIPNSVTTIGNYAFNGCSGLTSITIPNSVKEIGGRAFEGCSSLTSIAIPNSVEEIGEYTFYDCTGLTSVTIPNSVTSIGYGAFANCSSLTSIISEIVNPFEISWTTFYNYSTSTLTVPKGTKWAYQSTAGWKFFRNIVEAEDLNSVGAVPIDKRMFDIFDLNGNKVKSKISSLDGLRSGVYIVDGKKVVIQ